MHSLKPLARRRSLSCCNMATPIQKGKEEFPNSSVSHRWKILCSGKTSTRRVQQRRNLQNNISKKSPEGWTTRSCKNGNNIGHVHNGKRTICLYIKIIICMRRTHSLNASHWLQNVKLTKQKSSCICLEGYSVWWRKLGKCFKVGVVVEKWQEEQGQSALV